jgi:glycosyltransferase involved in cell wall biosynthesis
MVDPYDVEGMAKAMHRVLTEDGFSKEMWRKGLERAKAFSWKETARRILKVWKEVHCRGRLV